MIAFGPNPLVRGGVSRLFPGPSPPGTLAPVAPLAEVAVRKRLLTLLGFALVGALILPTFPQLYAYRQKAARGWLIDEEHFKRIVKGMSRSEVEQILGGPPGDFSNEYTCYLEPERPFGVEAEGAETWNGTAGCIWVAFDGQGGVRWRHFEPGFVMPPPSLAERVREWLRRFSP